MTDAAIKKIGVVGAGIMGSGIAQVFAMNGFAVLLHDVNDGRLSTGKEQIARSLALFVSKGKLDAKERDVMLGRITTTTELEDFRSVDFVIEAATEDRALKGEIYRALDRVTRPAVILASNTSSIPIAELARTTKRPELVIGMHFMNPPPLMKGVEVIRAATTSASTDATVVALVKRLGKNPVRANDRTGFVANRVLMPMIREAILALEEGVAERDDIDRCLVDCCNFPMGPLALADLIGLDTVAAILKVMAEGLPAERLRPPKLLTAMVTAGTLGRKTGKGFYDYT